MSQDSALDSHDLMKAGLGVTHNAFIVKAEVNGIVSNGAESTGTSGQLSVSYRF